MKILITGASGLLGRQVLELCRQQGHIVKALAFTRSDPQEGLEKLDLTDTSALSDCIHRFQPDAIIHTAAERRPDVVERDPQASNAINVDVPTNLSRIAADLPNVPLLINVSTDYVFDGSKPPYKVDDQPNPLNAYGVSKLQGERALLQNAKRGCFTNLRVPVLYGKAESNDESAVNILLDAIKPPTNPSGPRKKCDAYCVRYPTNVSDVSKALLELCTAFTPDSPNMPPITHFSAKEAMTKYDMCNVLSRVSNGVGFDTSTSHLDPEFEADPLATTTRPRHCKLDTAVIEDLGISVQCVSFEDWWRAYLEEVRDHNGSELASR
ncbi:NAD(P)-binding protein [Violaceomyces palustris]|uniref:NAD(P)-binding protein n=1 Tax=Violaceomyces palustris TaxID=1673888 RepID=A0ACD0NS29_9BASI|nr:NAD(P)-binding protein [Violaceomyces palustris]